MSTASLASLIELDERRRAPLAKFVPEPRAYLVQVEPDGTIVLTPAVAMAEAEAALLANSALMENIEESRRHPERNRPRPARKRVTTA